MTPHPFRVSALLGQPQRSIWHGRFQICAASVEARSAVVSNDRRAIIFVRHYFMRFLFQERGFDFLKHHGNHGRSVLERFGPISESPFLPHSRLID